MEGGGFKFFSWRVSPEVPLPSKEGTPYFFKDFCLKAKARIWPGLSYMCHIRSTAVQSTFGASQTAMPASVGQEVP